MKFPERKQTNRLRVSDFYKVSLAQRHRLNRNDIAKYSERLINVIAFR